MSDMQKKWLVKSGTYILGPFSSESIVDQLLDRSLSPRDEISGHMKNWISISDEPYFATTVEEIRIRNFSEEGTNSKTFVNFTATEDLTEGANNSGPSQKPQNSDKNYERRSPPVLETDRMLLSQSSVSHSSPSSGAVPQHNYYIPPISGRTGQLKKTLNWAAVVVIAVAGGYFFYSNSELSTVGKNKVLSQEALDSGLEDLKIGEFKSSQKNISKALQLNKKNYQAYVPMIKLLILDKQEAKARKLLNNKKFNLMAEYEKYNLVGLSYLSQSDFILAAKYFDKALAEKKAYSPALVNSAVALTGQKKISKANSRFQQTISQLQSYPQLGLQYAQAQIGDLDNNNKDPEKLSKAIAFLESNYAQNIPFYQEAQFFRSYIYKLLAKIPQDQDSELASLLDNDPFESSNLNLPLNVTTMFADWADIVKWCDQVSEQFTGGNAKAALSFCRFKNNDFEMAISLIQESLQEKPNSPLFLSLSALYHSKLNSDEKYSQLMQASLRFNSKLPSPYGLPFILKLQSCFKVKDTDCMKKYQKKLRSLQQNSLVAQYSAAQVAFLDKTFNKSRKIVNISLEKVPLYKPFIKLKNEIESYGK